MSRMLVVLFATVLTGTTDAWACPSCYGAADGPMIDGMNMAILTMLGITGSVLGAITSFFVMMRRRLKRLRNSNQAFVNQDGILRWNNF
jgi:heme/copper-type cytochrome/quinol oxidase subunit 2